MSGLLFFAKMSGLKSLTFCQTDSEDKEAVVLPKSQSRLCSRFHRKNLERISLKSLAWLLQDKRIRTKQSITQALTSYT
ncbi:hypothetical protein SAMN02745215_01785 [Desulfitobacterium chlororespirans DSM 11544]|uniref:Uncharacterized protein n=1 Tax=Desulfitobacterium chlororespirans DSM 11544 TaxID=1121395 RepID=A0A1M7TCR6_9FIRM|nr:hypothetical protein SAMN02745215_01785 [Desulfitobacterium chlororespirans DSM 11544]